MYPFTYIEEQQLLLYPGHDIHWYKNISKTNLKKKKHIFSTFYLKITISGAKHIINNLYTFETNVNTISKCPSLLYPVKMFSEM